MNATVRRVNIRRAHRCACRGYRHRIFGQQHDCLTRLRGWEKRLYCSSCPCSDHDERSVEATDATN